MKDMEKFNWKSMGDNLQVAVDGDDIYVKSSLKYAGAISASGKSRVIASSRGNQRVSDAGHMLGLNLYVPMK